MSRLTIDISPEQHRSLKAMAALEGKTIRQFALERLFPREAKPPVADERANGPQQRRALLLGELIDKPESQMDEAERAAWASVGAMLEERAAEARAEPASAMPADDVFRDAPREEGHAFK